MTELFLGKALDLETTVSMPYLNLITEALERSRQFSAVDRSAYHLGPEYLFGREGSPLAIGPLCRVDHDRVRVKLRIQFSTRVVRKARDDPVARRLDYALAFLLDSGLRRGRFEVAERHRNCHVVSLNDPAVVTDEGQQRYRLWSAESEIPTGLVFALLPPLEDNSVRQFAVEEGFELRTIDRSGKAERLGAFSVPSGRFTGAVLGVVVVLRIVGSGLRGGVKDADREHQSTSSPRRET